MVLTFTFTAVPSGFNKVWYSSSLVINGNDSFFEFPNPKKGTKNMLPKSGKSCLLEIDCFLID